MRKNALLNLVKQTMLLWCFWVLLRYALGDDVKDVALFVVQNSFYLIAFVIVISINTFYLFPNFYVRKRYVLYVLLSAVLITMTAVIVYHKVFPWGNWYSEFLRMKFESLGSGRPPKSSNARWLPYIAPLVIAYLGNTAFEAMRFARVKENEFIESEKQKLETELKFLKSQVNPHFLFNSLNNIYSLSITDTKKAPDSIMRLSEILRYMVYDSQSKKVPLESEINYIKNYIELMNLKDSRGMNIQMDFEIESSRVQIVPLLFIPFIENAFKHSRIEDLSSGFINIRLKSTISSIEFSVENSIPEIKMCKDKVGGVGLENTRKRLLILYPDQHELKIDYSEERFIIDLKLELNG